MRRVLKRRGKELIILISSLLVSCIVAELFLRCFHPTAYRQPPYPLPEDVWRELLHTSSSVPGLAYELAPNKEIISYGKIIRTNSFGLRDRETTLNKPPSLLRIVALGDSFTFGFGVSGDETYPKVLEKLLNESATKGDYQYEVLNFGVGGYSTRDEALVFKYKVPPWKPDLVIIGYVLNDPETEPVQPLHAYYQKPSWWQYSHLLRLIAKGKHAWDIKRLGNGNYIRYLHCHHDKWMSVVHAFGEIKSIADSQGIHVLLVIFPEIPSMSIRRWEHYPYKDLHSKIAETAREKDFFILDLYDVFTAYHPGDLRVSDSDGHPNKLGHYLVAIEIANKLLREPSILSKH